MDTCLFGIGIIITIKLICIGLIFEDLFLTVDSDLNGDSPQFTITCISAGGPASCVVWRIDKRRIADPITTSVLTDSVTGRYIHTLTVTERIGGPYSCSVTNNKPASEEDGIFVCCKYMQVVFHNYCVWKLSVVRFIQVPIKSDPHKLYLVSI